MSNRNSKVEHEFAKKRKKARPLNIFDVMSTNTRQKVGVPGRVWPRKDFSKKWKLILKSVQWPRALSPAPQPMFEMLRWIY